MKKATLTLCDKVLIGDIPTYKFTEKEELEQVVNYWLEPKDEDKSVFVCFQNWRNVDYRSEQTTILVTHRTEDVEDFMEKFILDIDLKEIDFSIFEFDSYEESFKYCTDLREGV